MLTLYCSSCGYKNLYALKKPDACAACNKSFYTSIAHSAKPLKIKQTVPLPDEPEDEVEADDDFSPNVESRTDLKKIQLDFIGAKWDQIRQPAKSIVGSANGETPFVRPRSKKINVKKIMDEIRKESQSNRKSIGIGDQ